MQKIKKILISLIMISFVYSWNSLSDAGKVLRNEKQLPCYADALR